MVDLVKKFFTSMFNFQTRISRHDYWMTVLGLFLVSILIGIITGILIPMGAGAIVAIIYVLYYFALLIGGLSMSVRRMHDLNKSGAWIFITFVPVIGGIWYLILLCSPGVDAGNNYPFDSESKQVVTSEVPSVNNSVEIAPTVVQAHEPAVEAQQPVIPTVAPVQEPVAEAPVVQPAVSAFGTQPVASPVAPVQETVAEAPVVEPAVSAFGTQPTETTVNNNNTNL